MKLLQPTDKHLLEMMNWFSNEQDIINWSGPNFRYPLNFSSFVEDLKLSTLSSFSLVSTDSEFLAFGQYYQRLDKCHLCRLIINPCFRGKGIVSELIQKLCNLGIIDLKVTECSLFVMEDNGPAIKAYQKVGFSFVNYPDKIPLEKCLYMVKS